MSRQYYLPSLTVTMTNIELRDWFAGMALQGILAYGVTDGCAEEAYSQADAMLAARERKEEK